MAERDELIKCAGFGGQGILTLGEIIGIAAMAAGKSVSWLPSYGPESRGGTCNCDVILSDSEIATPVVDRPSLAFVLNQPSMEKFEPTVLQGGTLLYDRSLARVESERAGVRYLGVPFTTAAIDVGTERIANMVALGAYVGVSDHISREQAVEAMKTKFVGKDRFFPLNEKAIATGLELASGL